jgi:L-ribulose-5-phosphate 3-epimerase
MRKSLSLRMFPPEMSTCRRVEIAAEAGYDGVEVNLEPWQEYSLASSDEALAGLRGMIEERGLCVSAVYDREQWHFPMTSADPATRARCRDIVTGLARAAAILGTDTVLVMPGAVDNSSLAPQPEITPYDVAYHNSRDTLARLAEAAERYDVTLGIENCPSKFLLSPLEYARLIDEVGHKRVKAYFDIGNVIGLGYPEHWIPILGPRLHRVHLKDIRVVAGGAPCATPLLAGDVNWPAVMAALRGLGYDSWATAEVFPHYRYGGERLIHDTAAAIDAILTM